MQNRWSTEGSEGILALESIPFTVCSSLTTPTAGTPWYFRYYNKVQVTLTGCKFYAQAITTPGVYEVGFYGFATSGSISKLSGGNGSVNVTAQGFQTISFTTPITLAAATDYHVGAVLQGGSYNIIAKSSILNYTPINFYGASSQSALPATESSRNAASYIPYLEFITA